MRFLRCTVALATMLATALPARAEPLKVGSKHERLVLKGKSSQKNYIRIKYSKNLFHDLIKKDRILHIP